MGGIALEKSDKTRFSVTVSGTYRDMLNHLIEEGIFLSHGEVFRDSLRRTFRAYGLEPFTDKVREAEKVPEDVAPS